MSKQTTCWDYPAMEKEFKKMIRKKLVSEYDNVFLEYHPPSGDVSVSVSQDWDGVTEGRVAIAELPDDVRAGDILRDYFDFGRELAKFGEYGDGFADFCEGDVSDSDIVRKIVRERGLSEYVVWKESITAALRRISKVRAGCKAGGSAVVILPAVELYRRIKRASKANAGRVLERWDNHILYYDSADGSIDCFPAGDEPPYVYDRCVYVGTLVPRSEPATACKYAGFYCTTFGTGALFEAVTYVMMELREMDGACESVEAGQD